MHSYKLNYENFHSKKTEYTRIVSQLVGCIRLRTTKRLLLRDQVLGFARGLRFVELNLTLRVILRELRLSNLCKFDFHTTN